MTFRIQKTIIGKYLALIDQDVATESEILELLTTIADLNKKKILLDSDIYSQKIDLICSNLLADYETVKRKRTKKEITLELRKDIYQIFENDLEGVDYTKTNLSDLHKFDYEKEIAINPENVKAVLENLIILKRRLTTEKDFEKFVSDQLIKTFGKEQVHRQFSVGGFLALKTDIDIGNGQVGIELKIADNLSAADMQRVVGQVLYYKKRFYNDNLILFIVSKTKISSSIKELKDFIEELGATVIFTTAINNS